MEEQIVSFETARQLKKKGFNEYCYKYYVNSVFNSFKKEHGQLKDYLVQDEDGDVIGFSKRINSKGQPHIIIAPTQSLAQKWLREVHNIHMSVICSVLRDKYWNEIYGQNITAMESVLEYSTYEEALENALQEALKLIK